MPAVSGIVMRKQLQGKQQVDPAENKNLSQNAYQSAKPRQDVFTDTFAAASASSVARAALVSGRANSQ